MSSEIEPRSVEARAQYYREMAYKAAQAAKVTANANLRESLHRIAEGWHSLAVNAEINATAPLAPASEIEEPFEEPREL